MQNDVLYYYAGSKVPEGHLYSPELHDRELIIRIRGPFLWLKPLGAARKNILLHGKIVRGWTLFFRDDLFPNNGLQGLFINGRNFGAECLLDFLKKILPDFQYGILTDRIRRFAGERELCSGIFLKARPGTITAIMGPSGCGKSVFLKILSGYDFPDEGTVTICGDCGSSRLNSLGFVPQGHAMLADLTGEAALHFRLQLRYPFLSKKDRNTIIRRSCRMLNLSSEDQKEFDSHSNRKKIVKAVIHKKIGHTEWVGNYPSGGQRRRINIAHELVLQPRVLLLDEPTSGLSSEDSDELMRSLEKLARDNHVTIVATLHQPSMNMFHRFDDLLLLTYGGKICYYGPARSACANFRVLPEGRNHAEILLAAASNNDLAVSLNYEYEKFVKQNSRTNPDQPYLPE